MNKNNADSIRRQYIKTDLEKKISEALNEQIKEMGESGYNELIASLNANGLNISDNEKTQKTFLKFGVLQNFSFPRNMPKSIYKHIKDLEINTPEVEIEKHFANVLKNVMKDVSDKILAKIETKIQEDNSPRAVKERLKKVTKTLVNAIKNSDFKSALIDDEVLAANKFIESNGGQASGVVFNPYKKAKDTALAASTRKEAKTALENIASIFEQIETDFASKSFNGPKQSPSELMIKAIENAKELPEKLSIGATVDKSQITLQRLKAAIGRAGSEKNKKRLAGFDYETIGNQIQEYSLMIGTADTADAKNMKFKADKSVHGFVGSMSDEQSQLVTNIVRNFEKNGTVDSDSEYILKRLWAIGKSKLIEDTENIGRYYFDDFADVDKANLMEVGTIEKGLETWINTGKKQQEANTTLSLGNKNYKMRMWEKDNLSLLQKAMDEKIPIVAHNGIRFDTSKLLVDILTNGSEGAKQYLLDSEIARIKSYEYFIDSQEVMKAIGSTQIDRQIAEKIANAGTTFNTNESFQIQTGVEKTGQRHMAQVDTQATLDSTVRAIFNEDAKLNFNNINIPENLKKPIEIGIGSVFTFNTSRGTLNTSNVNGLMFSTDSLVNAYRIGGPGMSVKKDKDGKYIVNDKDFGSFFRKDAPYAISGIKTYEVTDDNFYENAILLDSSIANKGRTVTAVRLSRLGADGEFIKENPLYLVGSKDTIQTTLSSIGEYIGQKDDKETKDKINSLQEAINVSADKKPAEKINSRAYSLWQKINSINKDVKDSKPIIKLYGKNKKIETITRDIVKKLKTNRDFFGFEINSINQLNNLVNAMPMLVRFDNAGFFSKFDENMSKLGDGNFDEDRMFSEFYNNIQKNIFRLMQYKLTKDKNELIPTQEFKESHFEFDLSGAPKSKGVQANFGGDFSNRSVIFDISEGAGANSENWRAATKLTRIYGLDQNKKAEAVGQYISHLKKHYGIEIDDREYVNFSADSMINYAVELMRKIRKGDQIVEKNKDGKNVVKGYKANYKDNAPRAKKIDSIDDNIVLDVVENLKKLDEDAYTKLLDNSFNSVKKYYRSFNNQDANKAINSYVDDFAISGFNGVNFTKEESVKDAVRQLTKNANVSEELIQIAADNLKNTRDTLRDFTLGVVFHKNEEGVITGINGDVPLTISENNIILGSITPGEGYILNVSNYLPRIRWNDSTNMPELYVGNTPVINNNVAYKDSKGNIKVGTYFEKVLENSAYKIRLSYLPKIRDDREKLNYIKTILSDIGAELRKNSGIKETSEELRGIRSFDYSAIYDSVMGVFTGEEKEDAIDSFVSTINKKPEEYQYLGAKDLILWAESFRNNNDWKKRPTVTQRAVFKQRLSEIFDIITSNEYLKKKMLGNISTEDVNKISGYLKEIDIATRHSDRDIGYLDKQESPFESAGVPHKRQENVAQKRAKTLNKKGLVGTIARYYGETNIEPIKQIFSGHMVYSATESASQREKRYDAFTVDTTQTDWQKFIHSDKAKEILGDEYTKLIEDMDMYIDESNSISNPHLLPLDHSISVQRIHGENLLPEEQFSLVDGVRYGTKAEIQRRKDLGYRIYLDATKDSMDKNGGVTLRFSYGRGLYVRKERNMLTVKAYPQDSKRIKAQGDGILTGRFYETIQGVQTEVSQDKVNEILKDHAVQTRIANAIRDTENTEEIQKILQEQVNTILKEKGMIFDYVLKEDTTTTGRKLLLTGEKTYTAYALSVTGRYFKDVENFFNAIGLGSKYLNVHLSQSFIDNIADGENFNTKSSLFINAKKAIKDERKQNLKADEEIIKEINELQGKIKLDSKNSNQKNYELAKKYGIPIIKEKAANLKEHTYTINEEDGTIDIVKKSSKIDDEVVRDRLKKVLKDVYGEETTAAYLQRRLMEERTYAWDKGIIPLLQSVFGEKVVNKLSIAAISSTGSDRAKSNHGESDEIIESIGHAAEARFMSFTGDEHDARINARSFINKYILDDNHGKIDIYTGELANDYRISTDKIKQNEERIKMVLGGYLPSGENANLAKTHNFRLTRDTIVNLSDSDSSVGSLVDKNRGFMYSTRVHTSLSGHRYYGEDIKALREHYENNGDKSGRAKAKLAMLNNIENILNNDEKASQADKRMFGAVINSIYDQLMTRGRKVSGDEASDISYIKNVIGASDKDANVILDVAKEHSVSIDRAINSYSIHSLALADKLLKTQELSESEKNENIENISRIKKKKVEEFAQKNNLPMPIHISEISIDKHNTPGNQKSIYNGGNFIIDMGEDERFWINGNRFIMNPAINNNIIGDISESQVSVKLQDSIATAAMIYKNYATKGKDVNYPDVSERKIKPAMTSAANAYEEALRTMLSGKDSVANLSTKNVLERSYSSKVRLQRAYKDDAASDAIEKYKGGAASDVVWKYGQEVADTSLYVSKEKAIELLGGEQHIRKLAKENNMSEDELTEKLLNNMASEGMLVTVKREPTNYTFSVSETRAFYKPSVGKGQTVIGEIIAGMMKADSDGDNISIAATLAKGDNGKLISNIERNVIGIENDDARKAADSLFQQAELSSDLLAHSTTAKAFRIINNGTDEKSIAYGEKLLKSAIGEGGKMPDYSIGGILIDYKRDVQAYNNLTDDEKSEVNKAFNIFRNSNVFEDYNKEGKILNANALISGANQYIEDHNGQIDRNLEIGIRAEAAKMIAREKVEADIMQGNAGIGNTHTNKARNLINELIVRGQTGNGMNEGHLRAIQALLEEIDEKGQAPKNHGEPADLEAVEKAFRHLYRNSYEMKTGKMSAQDNAEIFVKGIEDAIGVDNIGTLKRIKKEIHVDGENEEELANKRREIVVEALKNLLPEGMRVSYDSYYRTDSAAYVQNSGHSTPTWEEAYVDSNPLKQTVSMASEMSSRLYNNDDGEKLFHEMNILEEIPEVKRIRQKSEDIQESMDRNIVPGFNERSYSETISEAEERASVNALKEGTANIIRGIGSSIKSTKGLLGLAGAVMAAGFIGGNPSAPSGTEAMQTVQDSQPYEIQSVGNIQPQINQRAPQGYIINVNASSDKGQDYISGLMQQTIRAQFPNQNISMTMNINDSSSNISFRDVANYLRNAI